MRTLMHIFLFTKFTPSRTRKYQSREKHSVCSNHFQLNWVRSFTEMLVFHMRHYGKKNAVDRVEKNDQLYDKGILEKTLTSWRYQIEDEISFIELFIIRGTQYELKDNKNDRKYKLNVVYLDEIVKNVSHL